MNDINQIQLWVVEKKIFEHDEIQDRHGPWMGVSEHPPAHFFFSSAAQKTMTPIEEAGAHYAAPRSEYKAENFGDTLNLEPVEEKPLQEEPILLTTPKRKKLRPNLES